MRRLRFTRGAQRDLTEIFQYIATTSGSIARGRKVAATLRKRCQRIAGTKSIQGRSRDFIRPDLRSLPHGPYLIFIRYGDEVLDIVAIVHASRDLSAAFEERERRDKTT